MHFRYDREERGRVRDILRLEYARDALVDEFVETSSREDERVAEFEQREEWRVFWIRCNKQQ